MRLTSIDKLVALEVLLELLHDLDSHLQIMCTVRKDELTDLLALVGTLADKRAIVAEKVLGEEFIELVPRSVLILIDFHGKLFAEHECVCETSIDGRKPSQHHGQESVKSGDFRA